MLPSNWDAQTRSVTIKESDLVCVNHWHPVPLKVIGKNAMIRVHHNGFNEVHRCPRAVINIDVALPAESDGGLILSALRFGSSLSLLAGEDFNGDYGVPAKIDGLPYRSKAYQHSIPIIMFNGCIIVQLYEAQCTAMHMIRGLNIGLLYRRRMEKTSGHCFLLEKAMLDKAQEKGT